MILHPAIGTNRYCGPAALAILTGLDTDACATMLRMVSGKRYIKGIAKRHMLKCLQNLNLSTTNVSIGFKPHPLQTFGLPLNKWIDTVSAATYLVIIANHFVVVDAKFGMVCDNGTVYPLCIDRYRQKGKHVKKAWRIA